MFAAVRSPRVLYGLDVEALLYPWAQVLKSWFPGVGSGRWEKFQL